MNTFQLLYGVTKVQNIFKKSQYIYFFLKRIIKFVSMIIYTVSEYIQSKTDLNSKICAIEALIDQMLVNAVEAIGNSGTASYSMDDGQMKVTTNYRSVDEITSGVKNLEKIKQIYVNRRNGHTVVLRGRLNGSY